MRYQYGIVGYGMRDVSGSELRLQRDIQILTLREVW